MCIKLTFSQTKMITDFKCIIYSYGYQIWQKKSNRKVNPNL